MKLRILIACGVLLSACASNPSGDTAVSTATGTDTASLPAQTLAPGTCGLFLWTQDEPRRFILFYPAGAGAADAILDGGKTKLTVESRGGDIFSQFMTEMKFRSAEGTPVDLTLQPGDRVEGGRRVPSARMISQNAEGWEIITPLAGLTACQPE